MTTTTTDLLFPLHELARSRAPWPGYQFAVPSNYGPQPDPWHILFEQAQADLRHEMRWNLLFRLHPEAYDLVGNPIVMYGLNPQPLPPKVRLPQLLAQRLVSLLENSLLQASVSGNSKAAETYWSKWLSDLPDLCPVPPGKGPWPKQWPPIILQDMDMELPDFMISFAAVLQLEMQHRHDFVLQKDIHHAAEQLLTIMYDN